MQKNSYVKNAADVQQIKEARDKTRSKRDRDISDLQMVLSHAWGRRFFWRLLEECGVFRSSFTGNSQTFFNEGMRNIGLKLLHDMNEANPGAYAQMMNESKGE